MIARRIRRPALASLLMVTTVVAVLLPPPHIHLAVEDHDHGHGAVEHSHWAAHHQTASEVEQNDEDGRVLFVDHPALVPAAHSHIGVPHAAVIALLIPPTVPTFEAGGQRAAGNAPRDGPPGDLLLLRGPPTTSRL